MDFLQTTTAVGRKSGAKDATKKTKHASVMRCALCGRSIQKAAALSRGLPVGPGCALTAGLVQRKPKAAASVAERDTKTLELF